ncbi:MAG: DUF1120 domain-containing protein [Ewingella sp.]|uniref:DUF1120 domain-containing protein n=1 Tax=Ewingella TaxID=41201 RepID=UPI0033657A9A
MENKMMKNIFKVTALACLMAAASNAVAGPSANLQVKGTVTQGACTPTLSNGGSIDLGEIGVNQITSSGFGFSRQSFDLNINCSSATKVQISTIDNRADTADRRAYPNIAGGAVNNGLGKTADGVKIGAYTLAFYKTDGTLVADGENKPLIYNQGGPSNWSNVPAGGWSTLAASSFTLSIAESGSVVPTPIQNATFKFGVLPYLSPEIKNVVEALNIDGNLTFNINYL